MNSSTVNANVSSSSVTANVSSSSVTANVSSSSVTANASSSSVTANVSSTVFLSGFEALFRHSSLLFPLILFLWTFVISIDALVVFVVTSRPVLHRPMYVFIAAVLSNSMVASCVVYPKLLSDLISGLSSVPVSRSLCLLQSFLIHTIGSSSFMLLAAMAFDRFLSITRPLRYNALMSPCVVKSLLFTCWLLPPFLVGGAIFLASRLPLCNTTISRIYCDTYSFVSMSCGGARAQISAAYGLTVSVLLVFLPAVFVVFSYGHILFVCLFKSRNFSTKALQTCGPHIAVFLNYSLSSSFELLHRRVENTDPQKVTKMAASLSIVASFLVMVIPTVFNPLVYGLKVKEIYRQISKLLRRQT